MVKNLFSTFLALIIVFFVALLNPAKAAIVEIEWASSITDTNLVPPDTYTPENILGRPDGNVAHFSLEPLKYGTISGFGDGENVSYDSDSLLSLLNISEEFLAQGDFISIEYNGTGGGDFEGSNWLFDDETNTLEVAYSYNDPSPSSILSLGTISNDSYSNYFGFLNSRGTIGNFAYILFDIDGTSSVNPFSSDFSVTLTAGSISDPNTPEPDVMGVIAPVPIPGAIWLLGSAFAGLVGFRIKQKKL